MSTHTMQHQATTAARTNARALRSAMTDSERLLWSRLRGEQLGVKFRRQHPVGSYVTDFACLAPALIVELDGSQHAAQQNYDERRDHFLKSQGFDILRFPSNAPFANLAGVLQTILDRIEALRRAGSPHPNLPPAGEGVPTRSNA